MIKPKIAICVSKSKTSYVQFSLNNFCEFFL